MGARPVTVKQVVKIRKSKRIIENLFQASSTIPEIPNCELLLAYYASEPSMNKKIKSLYEVLFAHEELEIYDINLSCLNIDIESAYHLKLILHYFINIQELKLSKTLLGSKNLKRFSSSLISYTNLSFLHMDGNNLDLEGLNCLIGYFKYWIHLKVLNLSDNNLDWYCFECLGKSIWMLKDLTELHLSGNFSMDQGAVSLSYGVLQCKNMSFLGLANNGIGYQGVKALLSNSRSLENVNLTDNCISKKLGFLLKAKYKNIQLIV